jgi:excisionase family DNA binding protein
MSVKADPQPVPPVKPDPWTLKHDLAPREAAAYLGVSLSKLYLMLNAGEIQAYTVPGVGSRQSRRCVRESLEAIRNSHQSSAA